jgi:hypothetical protein
MTPTPPSRLPSPSKLLALGALALVSFAGPLIEVVLTGDVDPLGKFELGETVLALALVFWWYHVDKDEHAYRAGPLLNGGMLLLTAVAMPIYLVRSRGWKRGAIAILVAALVFAALYALGEAGEWLGKKMGPP